MFYSIHLYKIFKYILLKLKNMGAKKTTKKKKKAIILIVSTLLTFLVGVLVPDSNPIKTGIINGINEIGNIIINATPADTVPDSTYVY